MNMYRSFLTIMLISVLSKRVRMTSVNLHFPKFYMGKSILTYLYDENIYFIAMLRHFGGSI